MVSVAAAPAASPWRAELRATLALSLPLIGTQLAQIAILTTDVLLMGWLGTAALAAGALASNIYLALWVFGVGVLTATAPMMAQAIGRKRHAVRDVRRTVRQSLWMCVAIGAPTMIVVWHTEPVLLLLGQDPANAAPAQEYARALMWGLIPALWYMALRQFVAALQRPRAALLVQVATLVLNATLAYGLMFGAPVLPGGGGLPALGLIGAGIATSIANTASAVLLLAFILIDRRFRRFQILGRLWRPDFHRFAEIFRLGIPIAATFVMEVAAFSGAVYLMGLIGTPELAAHQIAIQCAATTFMVPLAIGQAATVRVGLHAGARDSEGVRRAGWAALAIGVAFMGVMAVAMAFGRWPLVGLFLDVHHVENVRTAELAAAYLAIAALFQIFDGGQAVGMGVLRGLKDTRVPMIIAGVGYWLIGLPVGAAAAWLLGWGGVGVWVGLAVGLALVAGLAIGRFAARERLGLIHA
jgi:MATE family multidrug resistance protein